MTKRANKLSKDKCYLTKTLYYFVLVQKASYHVFLIKMYM